MLMTLFSLRWWWRRRRDWQQRLAFLPTRKLADQTNHETETRWFLLIRMISRNLPWNHDPAWTSSVYRLNLTSFTGRHSHNRPSLVPSVSSIYICVYCTLKVSNPGEPSMILRIGGCESNSIGHILPNHFMHYRKTIEVQSANYWNFWYKASNS